MVTFLQNGLGLFNKKINLLIVDDDEIIRESLAVKISSSLFNTVCAGSLEEAFGAIGETITGWHCSIVDLDLGNGASGLDLFRRFPGYPFTIILSGLRSMTLASEAMHLGTFSVIDKDPSEVDRLCRTVHEAATLGFLLNGRPSPYLDTFRLLRDQRIDSVDAWVERLGVTQRTLYRICEFHPPLTPHYALALYRSIHFLLTNAETTVAPSLAIPPRCKSEDHNDPSMWIEYILQHYKG
ncbi:MAG: response regulator [Fibrobacter sp.]|nr:response regulator [Fibrobacter sp.]